MSGLVGYSNIPIKIVSGYDTANIKEWTFDSAGNIQLPAGGNVLDSLGNIIVSEGTGNIEFDADTIRNTVQLNPIYLETRDISSTVHQWTFESNGSLILPDAGQTEHNKSITRTTTSDIISASPTIVWTSISNRISSIKLIIQLEQEQTGDPLGFHTHSCEAVISARGASQSGIPSISVFGVNYTTVSPLVTFSVQRNVTNQLIEVVATLADTSFNAFLRIHSIELETRGS